MKLATQQLPDGTTQAVRVDSPDTVRPLPAADLGELFRRPRWRQTCESEAGQPISVAHPVWAAPVTRPGKVICVGLNYRSHILEMGRDLPEYPTLFAKYAEAMIGPAAEIVLPPESGAMDWEGELAVVIGAPGRRLDTDTAWAAIAGYTICNDVTARDFQYRTQQWLQGKTFETTTPFGPVLVTPEELPDNPELTTTVDGDEVQRAPLSDLVFGPSALVSYISTIISLEPGDIIATGTPGGVGHARKPPRYLVNGSVVTVSIDGIGMLENRCRVDG